LPPLLYNYKNMIEKVIKFFLHRHLLTNLIFIAVFIGGVVAWIQIPKEELPDITFDRVHISVNYPGASAEEVEYYVTRPIEEAVRGLDGIYSISSATGTGTSQTIALALENKLLSMPQVSSVNRSGYLRREIHIKADPQKLVDLRIPFNTVIREIQDNNVRQPAGNIESVKEPKVTLSAELNTIKSPIASSCVN